MRIKRQGKLQRIKNLAVLLSMLVSISGMGIAFGFAAAGMRNEAIISIGVSLLFVIAVFVLEEIR